MKTDETIQAMTQLIVIYSHNNMIKHMKTDPNRKVHNIDKHFFK